MYQDQYKCYEIMLICSKNIHSYYDLVTFILKNIFLMWKKSFYEMGMKQKKIELY